MCLDAGRRLVIARLSEAEHRGLSQTRSDFVRFSEAKNGCTFDSVNSKYI
jgi:hypothetical protein